MKDVITTWNNRILELSPKNKTGYKYVSCWYYPKIHYTHKLSYNSFDAAHLAAYDYILEKEIRMKYPDGWRDINYPICESNYPPAMEYERTYLHCPISEKDECKRLGGKFDWEEQKWYIPCYIRDHEPFEKWNRSDYGRLPKFEDTSGEIGKITLKTVFLLASEVGDYIGYSPSYLPEQRLNDLHYKYSLETFRGISKDKQESDIVENNEVVGKLDILTRSNTSAKPVNVLSREITDLIYNRKPLVSGEPMRLEDRFTSCAKTPTVVEKPLVSGEPMRLENRFTQHERDKLGELTPQEKRIVEERLHRNIRISHGRRLEKQTIRDMKTRVIGDNTLYREVIMNICGTDYVLLGRIDGIQLNDDGSRTLIEIKNRINGLFWELKRYESAQVQVYLHLTGMTNAYLVESYEGEINKISITRDHSLWNDEILPELKNFCMTLHSRIYMTGSEEKCV